MKIALVTTWNQSCGISEYSRNLYSSLVKLDYEVSIHSSKRFVKLKKDEEFVTELGMPSDVDVVHIQYEPYIFDADYINSILECAQEKNIPSFVTLHDNCMDFKINWSSLKGAILHKYEVASKLPTNIPRHIIPIGVPAMPVRIVSFGLGRNNNFDINRVCKELGFDFIVLDPANWYTQEELMETIKSGDGVVLWYPQEVLAGSSSCARMVIGARRPLFVNDVSWFEDLKEIQGVTMFKDYDDLKEKLQDKFYSDEIEFHNWDAIAKQHLEIYNI